MDTMTDHFTSLALRVRGNKCTFNGNESFTLPNCHGQTKAAYMNVWLQTKSYKKKKRNERNRKVSGYTVSVADLRVVRCIRPNYLV